MKPLFIKILKLGVVVDIIIVAFIVMINLPVFDEALLPELQAELAKPNQIATDNNAFIAMVGFDAPETPDHLETSLQATRARYELDYQGPRPEQSESWQQSAQADASWQQSLAHLSCISRKDDQCTYKLAEELQAQGTTNLPRVKMLMQRYRQLITLPVMDESGVWNWESPLPNYKGVTQIGLLIRADLLNQNDPTALVNFIKADVQFWRMVLAQSHMLVGQMVATAQIGSQILFVNALLNDGVITQNDVGLLQSAFSPLTQADIDIGEAILYEHMVGQRNSQYWYAPESRALRLTWLSDLFSQDRATRNDFYKYVTVPTLKWMALSSPDFYNQKDQFHFDYSAYRLTPSVLYNPMGKFLVNKSTSAPEDVSTYSARVRDLDGLLRLMNIRFAIENGLTIEQALRLPDTTNPYTPAAMQYDPDGAELYFPCLSRSFFKCKLPLH